jgi:acetoacetate decarboxylase
MLYALSRHDIDELRRRAINPTFSGAEMLVARFRTDRDVVSNILPHPLKAPAEPHAVAFVARYPETNFGCVYNEGALFVPAVYREEEGLYCLAMPVDDDMAMAGGRERLGFPKKMADRITLDRDGDRVVGSVIRKGTEILRLEATVETPASLASLDGLGALGTDEADRPCAEAVSFLVKFSPRPDGAGFDYLPRLVRQVTQFRPRPGLRRGEGRVTLRSSVYDPLAEVPIVEDHAQCAYGRFDNVMLPGKVVRRIWNVWRFLPHAFFKTDVVPVLLGWERQDGPEEEVAADVRAAS